MPEDAKPILVAVDFSSHSEHALAWALEAARRFEAPLVVLHVVHDPGYAPGSYRDKGADGPQLQEEVAQEMMDDFLRKFAEAHPGQCAPEDLPNGMCTKLAVGLPANRVVEVAEAEGAQLIVVGSKGRSALASILLGSKAERIAQLSPVPVTIVH